MPLPAKKALPLSKGPTNATSSAKAISKKAVPKNAGKTLKAGPPGKKSGKKMTKTKPGYELYSDESNELRQGCVYTAPANDDTIRTLMDEYKSTQVLCDGGPSMHYTVERHECGDANTTLFNRRLVSSTPDPERLADVDDATDLHEQVMAIAPQLAQGCSREENALSMLSDSEREYVRQQLDSALTEEATNQNNQLQAQLKCMLKSQKQAAKSSGTGSVPASAGVQTSVKRKGVPLTVVSHKLHGINTTKLPHKTDANHEGDFQSQHYPDQTYYCTGNGGNQARSNPGFVAPSIGTISSDNGFNRGSDIGTFHHFLHRDSGDLPPHFAHTTQSMALDSTPRNAVSNVSTGFIPCSSESVPRHGLPHGIGQCVPPSVPKPLSVSTSEDTGSFHASTPACSPVRSSDRPLASALNTARTLSEPVVRGQGQHLSGRKASDVTTATSARTARPASLDLSAYVSQTQDLNARPTHGPLSSRESPRDADTDRYTPDGYYINQAVGVDKDSLSPWSHVLAPSFKHMPQSDKEDVQPMSVAANDNSNNSNFYDMAQLGAAQTTDTHSVDGLGGYQQTFAQSQPSAEMLLEHRTAGFTDPQINPEVQMVMLEENLKMATNSCSMNRVPPEYTTQGPLKLRSAVAQLKLYTEVKGDLHVRQLVQQLIDTVEWLPQLKRDFSLEEYKKPFQLEAIRQRRRAKNLNVQLRQREKDNTKILEPDVQLEMLNLETEKSHLKVRLKELEEVYAEEKASFLARLASMEDSHRKRTDAFLQQEQKLQLQLRQKDHEALVSRQEQVQHVSHQNKELERMSLRAQSLQNTLSTADREKSILEIRLKQKDMEIQRLQETLGNVKQAAKEVMTHLTQGMETDRLLSLPCSRVLQDLTKSTPLCGDDYDFSASMNCSPLDISGNHRVPQYPTSSRSIPEVVSHSSTVLTNKIADSSHRKWTSAPIPGPASDMVPSSQPKITAASSKPADSKDTAAVVQDPGCTRSVSPLPLTEAAVAAHNQQMNGPPHKQVTHTVHSWDEAKYPKVEVANRSLPYHSDPESTAFHVKRKQSASHKVMHIQQWSSDVESERQQMIDEDLHSLHSEDQSVATENRSSHSKPDNVSQSETVPTLSEVPISQSNNGTMSETGTVPTLSEVSISQNNNGTISETGTVPTLSEVPISQNNNGTISETGTVPTLSEVLIPQHGNGTTSETSTLLSLSEYPISEMDDINSLKDGKPSTGVDNSGHCVDKNLKKYPDLKSTVTATSTTQLVSSDLSTARKANLEDGHAATTKTTESKTTMDSPAVSSPNGSLTRSASNTTQRDYFHGTQLDISMSTIPDDTLSTATGLTGVTISSLKSVDDAKFTENLNDLDNRIAKTSQRLQQLKKTFS